MFLNLRFSSDPATATAADSAEVAVRQLTTNAAAAEDGDEVQSISSTRQDSAVGIMYMVRHLVGQLDWVDYGLRCSTILPSCAANSANFPTAEVETGRGWNSQNLS